MPVHNMPGPTMRRTVQSQQQARPVVGARAVRPNQSTSAYRPARQQQQQPQVLQAVNPQQLAQIVGVQEAECMMQPKQQYIMQEEVMVQRYPVTFVTTSKRQSMIPVMSIPQATLLDQPMAQVQLTQCQPQQQMQAPCEKPCERQNQGCSDGSCNYGPYMPSNQQQQSYPW